MGIDMRWLATSVLVALGCAEGDSPPGVAVTDSAGIRIVTHAIRQSVPRWTLSAAPAVVLGADVGADLFQVGTVLKLPDGRYAVADAGNQRVVFFDSLGVPTSETGRSGEGPGEFQHLTLLARGPSDSLVVWDRRARRVSVLEPGGEFSRSFALESTEEAPFSTVVGVYDDGSFLGMGFVDTGGGPPASGRQIYSAPSFHFDHNGRFLSHAGIFPTNETYFDTFDGGFTTYPAIFGITSHRLAAGSRLLVATTDRYEFKFLSKDGDPLMILRREPRSRPVTGSIRSAVVDALVADSRADDQERLRSVLIQMEVPDFLPEFGDILVDGLGRLWVEEYEPLHQDISEWRVYDPTGATVASIDLPGNFDPTDAGEDFVLGVQADDLGVQTVVEYVIEDPGRPSA